jgi:glutamate synthase domain-containing protein 2
MNFIFKGAMSFGSISIETHETLAIAMNRYSLCYVSNVSILWERSSDETQDQ